MKLFYTKGACSLVVRIVINELGLNANYESVNLKTKKAESNKDFLKINPKGAVPTLELDNGEILTENAVILQFLADTAGAHQLLPALGNFKRYQVLEWINYIATEIHKSFAPLFNPTIPQEFKNEVLLPAIKAKFKFLSNHLQQGQYLMGSDFMLPDAYLFVMLLWTSHFSIDLNEWPNLARYFNELKKRNSVEKSLNEEG